MKKILFIATTVSLLFASCSNDEVIGTGTSNENSLEIGFRTQVDKGTRAPITDKTNLTSFTVTGWWDKDNSNTYGSANAEKGVFLFNAYNIARGEIGDWDYDPKIYWPINGNVDFFAYSPASSVNVTAGIKNYKSTSKIGYTVPEIKKEKIADTKLQEDFLVAKLPDQTNGTAKVLLDFKHALSRVKFFARKGNPDVTYVINEVKLVNLVDKAEFDYATLTTTTDVVKWSGHDPKDKTFYTADMGESPIMLSYDDADKTKYYSMLGDINSIMVMPQLTTLLPASKLEPDDKDKQFAIAISYKAYIDNYYYAGNTVGSANEWKVKYFAVPDPDNTSNGITFKFGKQYNFKFTFGDEIGDEVTFNVSTSEWTDATPEHLPEVTDYSKLISSDLLEHVGLTGTVTKADLLSKTAINISPSSPLNAFDFTGLEYFENLTTLTVKDIGSSTVKVNLDASKNSKLKEALFGGTINLGEVNLSNTALTKINFGTATFETLNLSNTKLKTFGSSNAGVINLSAPTVTGTLDLSGCGLKEITTMLTAAKAPKELILSNNNLETFTIPDGYGEIDADKKPVTKLDLSNNNLSTLTVPSGASEKYTLAELNLSNNNFEILELKDCEITTLNVSNNTKLTQLKFSPISSASSGDSEGSKIKIEKVNATGNPALKYVGFMNANYTGILLDELDIRDSRSLNYVYVDNSKITKLILWQGCTKEEAKNKTACGSSGKIDRVEDASGTYLGKNIGGTWTGASSTP